MFKAESRTGRLNLRSERPPINTSEERSSAAAIADVQNTSDYIRNEFFGDHESIINIHRTNSGGQIALKDPSGPYAAETILVIAAGPDSLAPDHTKTEFIYDYPFDMQVAYFDHILTIMQEMEAIIENRPDRDKLHVIATENAIATRTNDIYRVSRSIRIPHAQVFIKNDTHIEDFEKDEPKILHLVEEQELLQRYGMVTDFTRDVSRRARVEQGVDLQGMTVRQTIPYGYTFFPSRTNDVTEITRTMAAHHDAYTASAEKLGQRLDTLTSLDVKRDIIPQPSYRQYMFMDNGVFNVAISPEFRSYAGALEAAGIELKRGPEYPSYITPEGKRDLQQHLAEAVRSKTQPPLEVMDNFFVAD